MAKKVYLFATCLGGAAMGKSVVSAAKLLRHAGYEVIMKKNETCCGQPAYNTGFFEETKKVALYTMDLFNEDYPIVVPSGSCTGMMTHDYCELFKDTPEYEKAVNFSKRVFELSIFFDQIAQVDWHDKGEPLKVVWHSNCHALRIAKAVASSKNLIKMLKNVELLNLEHEEECCGFGGTFAVKEPEISNAMALSKINDIKNSGAKYVISGDGGCLLNISGTMSRLKTEGVKPIHLYDFLLARIEGESL